MQFGIFYFPADFSMSIFDLAPRLEERGFNALLLPEHTHIPTSRRTPWPSGRPLPKEYWRGYDQFVSLTVAALRTERLQIGTGICLVAQRDPIITAKEVSSVDQISGGRFLFGIGGGWNLEEIENHGTDPKKRWKLLRERVLAMKAIWTQDEAEFHGEMVDFDPIWQWPKPFQKPHPPILVGGNAPHTLERVVDYGDEWMPVVGREGPPFEPRVLDLQRLAQERGRGRIPVTAFDAPQDAKTVADYEQIGVHRTIFHLPNVPDDEMLAILDRQAEIVRSFR
jgi:probable F420-dependent oxidoreductase